MAETSYHVPPEKMPQVVTVRGFVDRELDEAPNPERIDPAEAFGDGGRLCEIPTNAAAWGRAPDGSLD